MQYYSWDSWRRRDVSDIPVLGDCIEPWSYLRFRPLTEPPPYEGHYGEDITHWVINRHVGGIHIFFANGSVRKAGLKELWTLRWTERFDTTGPGPKPAACGRAIGPSGCVGSEITDRALGTNNDIGQPQRVAITIARD